MHRSPALPKDEYLERRLYDEQGVFRGDFNSPGIPGLKDTRFTSWQDYGKQKLILLDAYRPPQWPFPQDWVFVLEAE